MPEESSAPNPPATRRRSAEEESGGGGKVLTIILVLLVLGLGFALYKAKSGGSGAETEAAVTNRLFLSNQVAQLEVKLKSQQIDFDLAQSNRLAAFVKQTSELMNVSNRLVQTRQHLEREEAALYAARNEISAKATAVGALEVQRDEWQRQAAVVPGLEREIATLKEKLNDELFKYVSKQEELGRVKSEKAELERKLEDPLFLHRQAIRVEQAAELRQRAAANHPIKLVDPRVMLDLQPDGSVRPSIATTTTPKK